MTVHIVERTNGTYGRKVNIPSGVFVEIRDPFRGVLSRFSVNGKREGRSKAMQISRTYLQHPVFVED